MGYLDNTGLAYFWEKIKSNFFPGTKLIPGNSDLNDYTTPGVYYCPRSTTVATLDNAPVPYAFSLQVYRTVWNPNGEEGCRQIFMAWQVSDVDENTNRIWTRAYHKPPNSDGSWSDWFHLIDDRFTIDGVHPKKQHVIHYGYCETEAATAAKTVDIPHFELVTGAFVIIKFKNTNTAASGSTTLNVSGTGAKNIKYRNGNVPASSMLASAKPCMFVYDGTYWQVIGDWEFHTRQFDRLKRAGGIYPKEAITTTTIIVNDGTGYIKLNSRPFDITYPILATGGSLTANTQNSNVYSVYPFAIKNTQNFTMTQNAPVFVKGTLNGVIFTPVSNTPLVQTLPDTEDGYQYLYLGYAYTYASMQLVETHPIVEYVGGAIRPYQTAIVTNSDIDSIFD